MAGCLSRTPEATPAFFFFQAEDGIRDLTVTGVQTCALPICRLDEDVEVGAKPVRGTPPFRNPVVREGRHAEPALADRSEEHTSELQSQSNLVCRLLLEKKKKKNE